MSSSCVEKPLNGQSGGTDATSASTSASKWTAENAPSLAPKTNRTPRQPMPTAASNWPLPSTHTNCCYLCSKTAYPNERVTLNGLVFHKSCFRCGKCQRSLSVANTLLRTSGVFCPGHAPPEIPRRSPISQSQNVHSTDSKEVSSTLCPPPNFSRQSTSTRKPTSFDSSSSSDVAQAPNMTFVSPSPARLLVQSDEARPNDVVSTANPVDDALRHPPKMSEYSVRYSPKSKSRQSLIGTEAKVLPEKIGEAKFEFQTHKLRSTSSSPTILSPRGQRSNVEQESTPPQSPYLSGHNFPNGNQNPNIYDFPKKTPWRMSYKPVEKDYTDKRSAVMSDVVSTSTDASSIDEPRKHVTIVSSVDKIALEKRMPPIAKLEDLPSVTVEPPPQIYNAEEEAFNISRRNFENHGSADTNKSASTQRKQARSPESLSKALVTKKFGNSKVSDLSMESDNDSDLDVSPRSLTSPSTSTEELAPRTKGLIDSIANLRSAATSIGPDVLKNESFKSTLIRVKSTLAEALEIDESFINLRALSIFKDAGSRYEIRPDPLTAPSKLNEAFALIGKLVDIAESQETINAEVLKVELLKISWLLTSFVMEQLPAALAADRMVLPARLYRIEMAACQPSSIDKRETGLILEHIDNNAKWYRKFFLGKEHRIYMSYNDVGGPVCVSIVRELTAPQSTAEALSEEATSQYRIIIRQRDSRDIRRIVRTSELRSKKKGPDSHKSSWRAAIALAGDDALSPWCGAGKLKKIKDRALEDDVLSFDEHDLITKFKFGVLYCGPGQQTEEEWFGNKEGSVEFKTFLETLGKRINLVGWTGFAAGLDIKTGNTGAETIVNDSNWKNFEVTYHVSTLLPYDSSDRQQIQRKRHIGNDVVCLVFLEGEQPFDPSAIRSQFLHVFIVVRKISKTSDGTPIYKVSVVAIEDVPSFGPPLPDPPIFSNIGELKAFLLAKMVNAEFASYKAPKFALPHARARTSLLENLVVSSLPSQMRKETMSNDHLERQCDGASSSGKSGSHRWDGVLLDKGRRRSEGTSMFTRPKSTLNGSFLKPPSSVNGGESLDEPSNDRIINARRGSVDVKPKRNEDQKGLKAQAKNIFASLSHLASRRGSNH